MLKNNQIFVILFFLAIFFLSLAFLNGEIEFGFFLIFPFIIGSGFYSFIGFLCIFIAR